MRPTSVCASTPPRRSGIRIKPWLERNVRSSVSTSSSLRSFDRCISLARCSIFRWARWRERQFCRHRFERELWKVLYAPTASIQQSVPFFPSGLLLLQICSLCVSSSKVRRQETRLANVFWVRYVEEGASEVNTDEKSNWRQQRLESMADKYEQSQTQNRQSL